MRGRHSRPGRSSYAFVNALSAVRRNHVPDHLRAAGVGALADVGFLGLDNDPDDPVVVTGFNGSCARRLSAGRKEANRVLAAGRALAEHGFAHLKKGLILARLRTDPARATDLLRAVLVLTYLEVRRRQTIYSADSRPRPA